MAAALPSIAVPGQVLGTSSAYTSGPGTHTRGSSVCASIAGPVIIQETEQKRRQRATLTVGRSAGRTLPSEKEGGLPSSPISGLPNATDSSSSRAKKAKFNTLPAVDSVILGRVTRVQKRQAALSILHVLDEPFTRDRDLDPTDDQVNTLIASSTDPSATTTNVADDMRFQALIRKEDVRAVEKDRVVVDDMFRVGDIVRATVISIGDQSAYYATTAGNELGVVIARSETGNMMYPASWKEMRDPITGAGEPRKVAKPF